MSPTPSTRPTLIDRAFRPFAKVQAGEGLVALLLFGCVFSILCAYYVLKTAREGLILSGGLLGLRGEELKLYATGAMAVVFVGVVPAYGALASRVRRIRLINVSHGAVLGCLVAFYALGRAGLPIGLVFYIWLGLISMFLVAQFWSYANDLYTEAQGKRLFAIIAIGGSLGAIVGPRLTTVASTFTLLIVAAGLLAACLVLFNVIERLHVAGAPDTAAVAAAPIGGAGGFSLVVRDRYLLAIAAMALVANLVNTTGEYVLSSVAANHAADVVSASAHADLIGATRDAAITADRREVIKAFYGDLFFWVNLVGFLVQAFVVSRVLKRIGFADILEDNFGLLGNVRRNVARRLLALHDDAGARAPARPGPQVAIPATSSLGLVDRLVVLRRQLPLAHGRIQALAALAQAAREVHWPAGALVTRAGDPANSSVVLLEGAVRLPDGRVLGPGDALGAIESLAEVPHRHTAEAITAIRALECPAVAVLDVVEDHTDLGLAMIASLASALLDHPGRATRLDDDREPDRVN